MHEAHAVGQPERRVAHAGRAPIRQLGEDVLDQRLVLVGRLGTHLVTDDECLAHDGLPWPAPWAVRAPGSAGEPTTRSGIAVTAAVRWLVPVSSRGCSGTRPAATRRPASRRATTPGPPRRRAPPSRPAR